MTQYKLLKVVEVVVDELPATGSNSSTEQCVGDCQSYHQTGCLIPTPEGPMCQGCLSVRIFGRHYNEDGDIDEEDPDCTVDESAILKPDDEADEDSPEGTSCCIECGEALSYEERLYYRFAEGGFHQACLAKIVASAFP